MNHTLVKYSYPKIRKWIIDVTDLSWLSSCTPKPNMANSSSSLVVLLSDRVKAPCLLGKTIHLMACSQPFIAMVTGESETAGIVRKTQCGRVVEPVDVEDMGYLEPNISLGENVVLCEQIFCNFSGAAPSRGDLWLGVQDVVVLKT